MKRQNHGEKQRGPYFEGWYLKCQTKAGEALALIPALHIDAAGRRSASLQVVTGCRAWQVDFPCEAFDASREAFSVRLGESVFSSEGMALDVDAPGLVLRGRLDFGPLTSLASDIMGPFRLFARMECAHGVVSMAHSLSGQVMLPVGRFTGCICAICCGGREVRLATYRGARAERWSEEGAVIRQGRYRLEIDVLSAQGLPLRAPVQGEMTRTIRESLCAKVRYRFYIQNRLLFDHTDERASFEFSRA